MLPTLTAAAPEATGDIPRIFLMLVTMVSAAYLGGRIFRRIGQPAVLGELLLGILVGPSVLALVTPTDPIVHVIAEFGIVILLFQIGLHTNLRALLSVGPAAVSVGLVGVVLPFFSGYLASRWLGVPMLAAVVCGAALTATSIGISARILGDIKALDTTEGKTVLGAAVLDDVIGLVILAVVSTLVAGGAITVGSVSLTVAKAVGFLAAALLLGRLVAPRLFAAIERGPGTGTTGSLALAFALLLAALAALSGSALIIGAFAAGLILHDTSQRPRIESSTSVLGHFFVPIFFVSVGASVDLRAMTSPEALLLGGVLLVVGIATKFLAGYAPFWMPMRHALVGAAMVPRGEVGLIFAQMGFATAALTPELFGALMLMVMGTTFVTPPWLAWLAGANREAFTADDPEAEEQDIGTMDDLVSGEP
jgi:Kef-type K+ transport system membrane component KefB